MADRKTKFAAFITSLLIFSIIIFVIYNKKSSQIKYTRILMGTLVEVTIEGKDELLLNEAAEAAFDEIRRLEGLMSHYNEESDVARINRGAGKEAVAVSKETLGVIELSLEASRITSGAFDITMGILGRLWKFSADDKEELSPPLKKEVAGLLPFIEYRKVIVDKVGVTVKLADEEMKINLGGVAKGYIIGKAATVLKKSGIRKGIIHAGGDMVVFNESDKSRWIIGIQDPRNKDKIIGVLKVSNTAIATSGDYERFFIKDGKRYHHIMDPSTGFPADKSMAATVIAADPAMADAISTAVFVMGPSDGMKLIEESPDVEGLIIGADGKVTLSSGLREIYTKN